MSEVQSAVSGGLASVECLSKAFGEGWLSDTLVAAAILVIGGLASKAASAIFNEYVKRFWIKLIHPDEIAAAKAELTKLQAKIETERQEVDGLIMDKTTLLQSLDKLFGEVIALRVENNRLRSESGKPSVELPIFSETLTRTASIEVESEPTSLH